VRYYVRDYYGEDVEGCFYQNQVKPVADPDFFPVEKILQRRTVKGEKQVLAKLLGYVKPVWMPAGSTEAL
jgi:hypothetical protein